MDTLVKPTKFIDAVGKAICEEFIRRHPSFELMQYKGYTNTDHWGNLRKVKTLDAEGNPTTTMMHPAEFRVLTMEARLTELNVSTLDAFLRYLYGIINDPTLRAEDREILYYAASIKGEGKERPVKRFWNANGFDERIKMILTRAKKRGYEYTMTLKICLYL